jgi:hypothetical protein
VYKEFWRYIALQQTTIRGLPPAMNEADQMKSFPGYISVMPAEKIKPTRIDLNTICTKQL